MLHQVGVSFHLYYDARKHKIKRKNITSASRVPPSELHRAVLIRLSWPFIFYLLYMPFLPVNKNSIIPYILKILTLLFISVINQLDAQNLFNNEFY